MQEFDVSKFDHVIALLEEFNKMLKIEMGKFIEKQDFEKLNIIYVKYKELLFEANELRNEFNVFIIPIHLLLIKNMSDGQKMVDRELIGALLHELNKSTINRLEQNIEKSSDILKNIDIISEMMIVVQKFVSIFRNCKIIYLDYVNFSKKHNSNGENAGYNL